MKITLQGSPFSGSGVSDPESEHLRSQWQITSLTDITFANVIYDSGESTDLTSHTTPDMFDVNLSYLARVRYYNGLGWESDWSDPIIIASEPVEIEIDPCTLSLPVYALESIGPSAPNLVEDCGVAPPTFSEDDGVTAPLFDCPVPIN